MLNRRQARWAQFLTRFLLKIVYRRGILHGKAYALSQISYLTPHLGETAFDNQKQALLDPSQLQMVEISALPLDSSILDIIRKGIPSHTFAQ